MPLVAAATTVALTPLVIRYATRAGLIDEPDPRRLHQAPVPRGGGLAVVLAVLAAAVVALGRDEPVLSAAGWALVGLLAGLGFWDDHRSPPAWIRGGLQLLFCGLYLGWVSVAWWWLLPATLAAVWWVNLFNFMDGANGVAVVQGGLSALLLAALSHHFNSSDTLQLSLALAASLAVFLPFNFPAARVFLGDVGSYGIAGLLLVAALPLVRLETAAALAVALAAAPFVVDASLTLLRRLARGERWYNPHRQHVYQRLIAAGCSPARLVAALAAVNVLFIYPLAGWAATFPRWAWLAATLGYGVLTMAWLRLYERTKPTTT